MKLQEWVSLDAATRRRLITEWLYHPDFLQRQEWQLGRIVKEAADSLAVQLAAYPAVTAVTGVITHDGEILVTTSLSQGEKLPGVPEEFATFPVLQFGVRERKRDYLQRVEFVFRAAGVSEQSVAKHVSLFDRELRDIHTPCYCDTPAKWIAEVLALEKSQGRFIGGPLVMFGNALQSALLSFFKESDPARVGLDPAAMSRLGGILSAILSAHGL